MLDMKRTIRFFFLLAIAIPTRRAAQRLALLRHWATCLLDRC